MSSPLGNPSPGISRLVRAATSLAVFLAACNIFNPSGDGSLPENSEGMTSVGQSRLVRRDWDGAMKAFAAAIKQDSTKSLAYYGYAKAVRFKYGLNGLSVSRELTDTAAGLLPFANTDDATATAYLQATIRINPVLGALVKRDSLDRLYRRSRDPDNPYIKPAQREFIKGYLARAAAGEAGLYGEADFPLMDGRINYEKVALDLTLTKLVFTFINLKDLNGDTLINEDDNIEIVEDILNLFNQDLSADSLATKSRELFREAKNDPEKITQLNNVIDKVADGSQEVEELLELSSSLGIPGLGEDGECSDSLATETGVECGADGELTGDLQSTIKELGGTVRFYKLPDGQDNDGDGCVDEEIYDGEDNDGDGLIDEDARDVAYGEETGFDPVTFEVLVDIDVTVEEIYDPADSTGGELVELNDDGRLTFTDAPGFWSDTLGIEAHKSEEAPLNHAPRFYLMERQLGQSPPYNLSEDDLEFARRRIGGCWNQRP